jgi:hypothetical protein
VHEGNVIDFCGEFRRRSNRAHSSALREHALDKCEEMFMRRDWNAFAYWLAIFQCERDRLKKCYRGRAMI